MLFLFHAPQGLSRSGYHTLLVAGIAVILWITDFLPTGVTSIGIVILLIISGAVSEVRQAFYGFSSPVAYFLVGVLTIGFAVAKSGLAERMARFFLTQARGRATMLYAQMICSFPLLTLLLPSATTRTGILIHIYDQALTMSGVSRGAPLAKAIMMALTSINRLASTLLLTGGITPVAAAGLIGGFSWTRWFVLMSVPYAALLGLGSLLLSFFYRAGFRAVLLLPPDTAPQPLSSKEIRTAVITSGASLLWLTDALHHWHPVIPALLAWIALISPGIGVMSWKEFEQNFPWSNFLVLASSLSLGQALIQNGTAEWVAQMLITRVSILTSAPFLLFGLLMLTATLVRLVIPNIVGFLGLSIPLAMAVGATAGLNPVLCGLVVMITGDAVLFYPAQGASSLVVYERGHLTSKEIFLFGIWMTLLAYFVVMAVALPYWTLLGERLQMSSEGSDFFSILR